MASYGYGSAQELLKIVYDTETIRSLVPEHVGIWNKFKKWDEPGDPGGKWFEFAVTTAWPNSVGSMPLTSGVVRTPSIPVDVNGRVYARQFHATMAMEQSLVSLSAKNPQAFAKALDHLKGTLLMRLARLRVLNIYGNHAGTQAYVNQTVNNVTFAVNGQYGFLKGNGAKVDKGAEVFMPGERIVIDPDGTPQYRIIASTNPTAGTITCTVAANVVSGMKICFGESGSMDYNNNADGFADLLAPVSAGAYLNIDPATSPTWIANRYTGSTAGTEEPLDSSHVFRIVNGTAVNSGADVNIIIAHSNMMQEFAQYFEQQVQYQPGTKWVGGMKELGWNIGGKAVSTFFDATAPHNCLIGLTESELARFVADEGGWNGMGGEVFHPIAGTTQWIAQWVELWNVGTRKRNAHAIQMDLSEPI